MTSIELVIISTPYSNKLRKVARANGLRRPNLSPKLGNHNNVVAHPMNIAEPRRPIFHDSSHMRLSFCYQLFSVLGEVVSMCHDTMRGSPEQIFAAVHIVS